MDYFSICDGIGAAHSALLPLGYQCAGVSEVDRYCNELVKSKFNFENFGDFSRWQTWGSINAGLVIGGTPCTAFSFIGRRRGTQDSAGKLTPGFIQFVGTHRPRWVLWENVPGVFTIDKGRLFRWMLNRLSQFGYNCAWRVLDSQYFGVAQRRRRVFVVANLGNGYSAAKVLFDGSTIPIPTPKSRGTNQEDLRTNEVDFGKDRYRGNNNVAGTLIASPGGGVERLGSIVLDNNRPRWLTLLERERLMGFPDGYTSGFSDSQRHRMLGNSMAVPIVRWIGQRILTVDRNTMELSRAG